MLSAYRADRFIALTVAVASTLAAIGEFVQLHNQVVSINLALRELHALLVWWDSLSLVRRRTPDVTARVVQSTERAFLDIVIAHTTAASNTQKSVQKSLDGGNDGEEEGEKKEE